MLLMIYNFFNNFFPKKVFLKFDFFFGFIICENFFLKERKSTLENESLKKKKNENIGWNTCELGV